MSPSQDLLNASLTNLIDLLTVAVKACILAAIVYIFGKYPSEARRAITKTLCFFALITMDGVDLLRYLFAAMARVGVYVLYFFVLLAGAFVEMLQVPFASAALLVNGVKRFLARIALQFIEDLQALA
ncbi:hypothetical protein Q7P37_006001 [Cladosporium fusiforme]